MADKLQDLPLGQEIIDLVVAARNVAYNGDIENDELRIEIDVALEKFAAIVPWENEPEDDRISEINSITLITEERIRQVNELGHTPDQDAEYLIGTLTKAAIAYALTAAEMPKKAQTFWPWGLEHFKPRTPLEDLQRAGALIAAEMDRIMGESEKAAADPDPRDAHIAELRAMVERGHAREQDLVQFGHTLQAELGRTWKRLDEAEQISEDQWRVKVVREAEPIEWYTMDGEQFAALQEEAHGPERLYRPSNGTEGDSFHAKFCDKCEYMVQAIKDPCGNGCEIQGAALAFDIDSEHYPMEWVEGGTAGPRCTRFAAIGTGTHEQRAKDKARYDEAMAEMRAAQQ